MSVYGFFYSSSLGRKLEGLGVLVGELLSDCVEAISDGVGGCEWASFGTAGGLRRVVLPFWSEGGGASGSWGWFTTGGFRVVRVAHGSGPWDSSMPEDDPRVLAEWHETFEQDEEEGL